MKILYHALAVFLLGTTMSANSLALTARMAESFGLYWIAKSACVLCLFAAVHYIKKEATP